MKRQLEVEDEFDFSLLGICTHVKDYRLSWEINQRLGIELEKSDSVRPFVEGEETDFPASTFNDEDNFLNYVLIANKQDRKWLVPEQPQIDFLLKISGSQHDLELKKCKSQIQKIELVLTVIDLQPKILKSRLNLVF